MRVPFALALATTALSFASMGAAQTTLTQTGGVLEGTINYALQGDPGEIWILMPSLVPGPTPLSIFDAADTRVLSVGFDQFPIWAFGFLSGTGTASHFYGLPNDPSLQGLGVYVQFVTFPGSPFRIDDISNPTSIVFGASGTSTNPIEQPADAWTGHVMTVLSDGRVLRSGGTFVSGPSSIATDTLETWDPQTGMWTAVTGTMSQLRAVHTATQLQDGRVLIVGGGDSNNLITASCDLYDPVTGAVTATDSMSEPRTQHSATLLQDGRVLVIGGTSDFDFSDPLAALAAISDTAEVYNPITNQWSNVGSLPDGRVVHSASLLNDGRVLVTGGLEVSVIFGIPFGSVSNDARVFNPGTNSFQNVADFSGDRLAHAQLTLSDGRVLVAGGTDGDLLSQTFTPLSDVWAFDPISNSWTQVTSLAAPRVFGQLVEVAGDVLILQGLESVDLATLSGIPVLEVERTDLSASTWTVAGLAITGHVLSTSQVVDDGTRVLTVGAGVDGVTDAELFVR